MLACVVNSNGSVDISITKLVFLHFLQRKNAVQVIVVYYIVHGTLYFRVVQTSDVKCVGG